MIYYSDAKFKKKNIIPYYFHSTLYAFVALLQHLCDHKCCQKHALVTITNVINIKCNCDSKIVCSSLHTHEIKNGYFCQICQMTKHYNDNNCNKKKKINYTPIICNKCEMHFHLHFKCIFILIFIMYNNSNDFTLFTGEII